MHEEGHLTPSQITPPERTPNGGEGKGQGGENAESTAGRLAAFLRQEYTVPGIDVYIETKFAQMGLLSSLEQAGILPRAENPNPFDPAQAEAQHNQWWAEHPEAGNRVSQELAKRAEVLRCLHIGALLREMSGRRFYPGRALPKLASPPEGKE